MRRKKLRATLLLRLTVLALTLGVFVVLYLLLESTGARFGAFVLLAVLWYVGTELEFLPAAVESLVIRKRTARDSPVRSIWFVDVDAERQTEREDQRKAARDNPSLW